MKHRIKSVIILLLAMALLFAVPTMMVAGCGSEEQHPNPYRTMEQHVQAVSKEVQTQFIDSGQFDAFDVHPIFNAITGEFSNFLLVEFVPMGFIYVLVLTSSEEFVSCGLPASSFRIINYTYRSTETIYNDISHFYGLENKNRYFYIVGSGGGRTRVVPIFRRDEQFVNLITNEVFDRDYPEARWSIRLDFSNMFYRTSI